MRLFYYFFLLISVLFILDVQGQARQTNYSIETGINIGFGAIQSDFSKNNEFRNTGVLTSGYFYFNFIENKNTSFYHWLKNHVKIKGEISFIKVKIDHFGKSIEDTNPEARLFKELHATSSILNIGSILEYHFFNLPSFSTKRRFSPYFGIGGMLNFSDPTVFSDIGDFTENPSIIPISYREKNVIDVKEETTGSLVGSIGTRFKLTYNTDLILDARAQYFFSDYIDGLKPNRSTNQYNDWLYTASVGYIFYIDQ